MSRSFLSSPKLLFRLPVRTPHPLQEPVSLRQPVHAVVALSHSPHEPTERIRLVFARVPTVLVNFADGDLHGCVVFGFDDAVGGAAFAGDVAGGGRCEISETLS